MTREELRILAKKFCALDEDAREWHTCVIPTPEPAYWDNLPHLKMVEHFYHDDLWFWFPLCEGNRDARACDGCGSVVWEYDVLDQTYIPSPNGRTYLLTMSWPTFCLSCMKALLEERRVRMDDFYHPYLWDFTEVIPSKGVFTDEYFRRHGELQKNLIRTPVSPLFEEVLKLQSQVQESLVEIGDSPSDEEKRAHNQFVARLLIDYVHKVITLAQDIRLDVDEQKV